MGDRPADGRTRCRSDVTSWKIPAGKAYSARIRSLTITPCGAPMPCTAGSSIISADYTKIQSSESTGPVGIRTKPISGASTTRAASTSAIRSQDLIFEEKIYEKTEKNRVPIFLKTKYLRRSQPVPCAATVAAANTLRFDTILFF